MDVDQHGFSPGPYSALWVSKYSYLTTSVSQNHVSGYPFSPGGLKKGERDTSEVTKMSIHLPRSLFCSLMYRAGAAGMNACTMEV